MRPNCEFAQLHPIPGGTGSTYFNNRAEQPIWPGTMPKHARINNRTNFFVSRSSRPGMRKTDGCSLKTLFFRVVSGHVDFQCQPWGQHALGTAPARCPHTCIKMLGRIFTRIAQARRICRDRAVKSHFCCIIFLNFFILYFYSTNMRLEIQSSWLVGKSTILLSS